MTTANGYKRTKERRGILQLLFPKKTREYRCGECGRPFLEHAEREPEFRVNKGNVELQLYRDRTGLRKRFTLRVGVWKLSQNQFYLGQLFSQEDFDNLESVITEAVGFVEGCEEVNQKDATRKMSSS